MVGCLSAPASSTGIFVSDGSSSGRFVSAQAQSLTVGVAGSSVVVGHHCSRQERNSVDACSSMELEKLKVGRQSVPAL